MSIEQHNELQNTTKAIAEATSVSIAEANQLDDYDIDSNNGSDEGDDDNDEDLLNEDDDEEDSENDTLRVASPPSPPLQISAAKRKELLRLRNAKVLFTNSAKVLVTIIVKTSGHYCLQYGMFNTSIHSDGPSSKN